jgi:deoxyadenosine/deoxycytidine kinase
MLNYRVFLEPTSTNPFLADFYKDPKKYALRMQVYLLRRRFQTYVEALKHMAATGEGVVLDRSIFSDWVFAEKNRVDGNIDARGFEQYTQLREQMLAGLPWPDMTLYLSVSPKKCFDRIHEMRKRAAEVDSGIPLAYLEGLDACYQQFLGRMSARQSNVVTLDWSHFGAHINFAEKIIPHLAVSAVLSSEVRELLADEQLVASRIKFVRSSQTTAEPDFESDDEELLQLDLNSSNAHEMRAMDAPPSPQDKDLEN